jgi:hypothetical protein
VGAQRNCGDPLNHEQTLLLHFSDARTTSSGLGAAATTCSSTSRRWSVPASFCSTPILIKYPMDFRAQVRLHEIANG